MPEHWALLRTKNFLREVNVRSKTGKEDLLSVSQYTGITRRKDSMRGGSGLVTTAKTLVGYKLVEPGDLVMNIMLAWRGSQAVSPIAGITSPAYSVFRVTTDQVIPQYLHYIYRTDLYNGLFKTVSTGVMDSRLRLYPEVFFRLPTLLPPPDEQHLIVRYLQALDAKVKRYIRTKRTLIARLQEQKQAIIQRAVTRGLDPNVKLKPSGVEWLGEVPEHWEVKQLKQAATILRGKFSHRPRNDPRFYGGSYPFIQTGSIARANKFITEYKQTLNEKGLSVSKLFPKGTLVMAIAANIGDVAVLSFDSCAPDSVIGFLPFAQTNQDYLYLTLTAMKPELLAEAPVNTQGNLSIARVGSMAMPYPPIEEQGIIADHINQHVTHIDQNISLMLRTIQQVHEYHTRLIANVVTGAVDVRAAAQALPTDQTIGGSDDQTMEEEEMEVEEEAGEE
ncbi:MAG: restriction endonuclease subunit S [Flavobacteriales bacterium]|nr:restriction endonuclease subunit S [Flavobacteriales bacterium]